MQLTHCILKIYNFLLIHFYRTLFSIAVFYCVVVGSRRLMPRMHCTRRLIIQTLIYSQVSPPETLVVKGGTTWEREVAGNLDRKLRLPRLHFRILLHAANMRHGTNGFTSLPKAC